MSELTPYLCVADARAAIGWYVKVLGAEVVVDPILMEDGRVGHVELAANGAHWMMSEEFASAGVAAPAADRGSAVTLHLTVDDVDALVAVAAAAGTAMVRGPDVTPHGRIAVFIDPFGHRWMLNQPTD